MDTALQRYTAFLKTVEFESFSKAADALQYSQPAVSRMIKGLEDEYGVRLADTQLTGAQSMTMGDLWTLICQTGR